MTSNNLYSLTRKDLSHPTGNWKWPQVRTSEAQSNLRVNAVYFVPDLNHRYASFTSLTQGELKLDSWIPILVPILALVIGTVLVQT